MRYATTAMLALGVAAALAGCERPTSTSSTTVVKEPTIVQKETVVREVPAPATSSTTIVQAPPPVTIEAPKPEIERSRSRTTTEIETPAGTARRTETEVTKTTR